MSTYQTEGVAICRTNHGGGVLIICVDEGVSLTVRGPNSGRDLKFFYLLQNAQVRSE